MGVCAAEKYEFGCLGHLKAGGGGCVRQSGIVEREEFPYSLFGGRKCSAGETLKQQVSVGKGTV